MKYKEGTMLRIKSESQLEKEFGKDWFDTIPCMVNGMMQYLGQIGVVCETTEEKFYRFRGNSFWFHERMLYLDCDKRLMTKRDKRGMDV